MSPDVCKTTRGAALGKAMFFSAMLVSYRQLAATRPGDGSSSFCRREIRRREGLLATDAWGSFVCSAGDGECKRAAEATVPINDKMIVLGLQAHNHWGGLISYFNADRGGQAYAYKPELP